MALSGVVLELDHRMDMLVDTHTRNLHISMSAWKRIDDRKFMRAIGPITILPYYYEGLLFADHL